MNKRLLLIIVGGVACLLSIAFTLTSCAKDDALDDEEYPAAEWRSKNEAYQKQLFDQYIVSSTNDRVIKSIYSSDKEEATYLNSIVVKTLEVGEGRECPLQTDSVRVIYDGRLLPSPSHAGGYFFDRSYSESISFDEATTRSIPAKFSVSSLTTGFATALQHMHVGDAWEVTIPYTLAYGTEGTGSIPGYSSLIFRIRLMGIYHNGQRVPDWK